MYGFAFYGTIGGTNPRANPDFTAQTPETRTFTDADGKVWTLHQSATFADSTIRFTGGVYTWPVEWDQIGRAACRESGCQHVSISVFAVSINKKIENQPRGDRACRSVKNTQL